MRRASLFLVVCCVTLAVASRADDEQTVRTKSGAEYRGELMERIPGDHVTLRMPGMIRRIEWSDIDTRPEPPRAADDGARTVRRRDGSLVRGQLVESIAGDHVVLRIATGALRRIEWSDIDPGPAPPATAEPPPPQVTVRTHDGSIYRGVIVEKVVGDHVLVRGVTGAIRRVEWRHIDTKAPAEPEETPPDVNTFRTRFGAVYRGEVLEQIVDDHVIVRLPWGRLQRIEWHDLVGRAPPADASEDEASSSEIEVDFTSDDEDATLQRFDGFRWHDVDGCRGHCAARNVEAGFFRVAGDGLDPTSPFPLRLSAHNRVDASMVGSFRHGGGIAFIITAVPFFCVGSELGLVALISAMSLGNEPGMNALTVGIALTAVGAGLLTAGIFMAVTGHSTVKVNGHDGRPLAHGLRWGLDGLHF